MKATKILCAIIAGIMVLGVMSFAAFAAETPAEEPGTTDPTTEETPGTETPVETLTQEITVNFSRIDESNVYNIVLTASDGTIINRLNSLDLTFVNTPEESAKIAYEIAAATDKDIMVNTVNDNPNRYEFHFNGKDDVNPGDDTATEIVIGTVTFNGYGKFNFKVDATVNTNAVHATTNEDNIVETFIPSGGTEANVGKLNIDSEIDGEITVPTKTLTIVITFNNNIKANAADYQDMTVTISGGDLTDDSVFELGNQAEGSDVVWSETEQTYTITKTLTENVLYSVKIEGEGYRTARCTVHMTDDKFLNFWNNVKDNSDYIEAGDTIEDHKVTKNFLAGDIVKDNNINIYDLSAVVSYFGEGNLQTDHPEYVKYDLNRDGVIDSKDVAYVLVSWDE